MALTTKDIGVLIRDRIEGDVATEYDWTKHYPKEVDKHEIVFVDVSDANNPIIHTSNGQKFKVVILAI